MSEIFNNDKWHQNHGIKLQRFYVERNILLTAPSTISITDSYKLIGNWKKRKLIIIVRGVNVQVSRNQTTHHNQTTTIN